MGNRRPLPRVSFWTSMALAAAVGCNGTPGNIGKVKGQVTLEGQPLPDATVMFSPVNGGSPSAGRTDGSGNYELVYSRQAKGAEIGEHRVSITTADRGDPDADPPRPTVPEKIPAKYNSQTTLRAEVKPGSNTLDFPVKNDGPIGAGAPAGGDGSDTCSD
jgi:hypothetical protein